MKVTHRRCIEAKERGYWVDDSGQMFGPKGALSIKCRGLQRYPTFSSNWGGRVFGIPVHIFVSYYRFGLDTFKEGLVVRHLNGDSTDLSLDNIVLGTHSQNNMDKPKEVRVNAAKCARASQGYTPLNAKLSEDQVREIRAYYKGLSGKKAPSGSSVHMCDKYGVSKTVLSKVKNRKYYKNVTD